MRCVALSDDGETLVFGGFDKAVTVQQIEYVAGGLPPMGWLQPCATTRLS